MSGDPELIAHIRETIRRDGPVTFAWFMEQALYHPQLGYYSSGRAKIGRAGDYFTNVSVGPLFGRLMTAQFFEMWEALDRPNEFTIVEQGAHTGDFACDVLQTARLNYPEFFEALLYRIVEPFPIWRDRQAETLIDFEGKIAWRKSIAETEPFHGVHFSNELIDALPVHLVQLIEGQWRERYVIEAGDGFDFENRTVTNPELQERLDTIPLPLPNEYKTEINLEALRWIEGVANKLIGGFVVTVDYGFSRDESYAARRSGGTLQGYANHQIVASPLLQIGNADITTHVEWTSVRERALACGLTSAGFTDQHHFITGLLSGELGREIEAFDAKTKRALQTLLHPGFLGMKFQFLVLSKAVEERHRLSGLRFAPGTVSSN